jgi:hypothetical protein
MRTRLAYGHQSPCIVWWADGDRPALFSPQLFLREADFRRTFPLGLTVYFPASVSRIDFQAFFFCTKYVQNGEVAFVYSALCFIFESTFTLD